MRSGFLAGGAAGLILAVAAFAAASERAGRLQAVRSETASTRSSPPAPLVRTLGVSRSATLVSYCWTQARPSGDIQACADGVAGRPAHTLRWRPGDAAAIDLRLPAHGVTFHAQRFASVASPAGRLFTVRARRVDRSGRHWIIHVPVRAARATDLLIFASFANGNVFADLELKRVQAR
jgi:hypothetical protein